MNIIANISCDEAANLNLKKNENTIASWEALLLFKHLEDCEQCALFSSLQSEEK